MVFYYCDIVQTFVILATNKGYFIAHALRDWALHKAHFMALFLAAEVSGTDNYSRRRTTKSYVYKKN